jgi:hypothetical protein
LSELLPGTGAQSEREAASLSASPAMSGSWRRSSWSLVFVTESHDGDALHSQRLDTVFDQARIAAVLEAGGEATAQAEPFVGIAKQQRIGISGEAPPSKLAITSWPSTGAKSNSVGTQSVGHRRGPQQEH